VYIFNTHRSQIKLELNPMRYEDFSGAWPKRGGQLLQGPIVLIISHSAFFAALSWLTLLAELSNQTPVPLQTVIAVFLEQSLVADHQQQGQRASAAHLA